MNTTQGNEATSRTANPLVVKMKPRKNVHEVRVYCDRPEFLRYISVSAKGDRVKLSVQIQPYIEESDASVLDFNTRLTRYMVGMPGRLGNAMKAHIVGKDLASWAADDVVYFLALFNGNA